jgi:hypothetical protein
MWHLRRYYQNLSGANGDFLILNKKLQGAFKNISDLFILMAVERNNATLAQNDPRQHAPFPAHKLTIEKWIDMFNWKVFETYVLESWSAMPSFDCVHHLVSFAVVSSHVLNNSTCGPA